MNALYDQLTPGQTVSSCPLSLAQVRELESQGLIQLRPAFNVENEYTSFTNAQGVTYTDVKKTFTKKPVSEWEVEILGDHDPSGEW